MSMQFKIIPIPKPLQADVACIRIVEHDSSAINVCLNGLPGIVFQHRDGYSPVKNITTSRGMVTDAPTLYVYGQMTEPGVMNHKPGTFTTTQIILKPHALHTMLGINATVLTNSMVDLAEFGSGDLNQQLFESGEEGAALLIHFLVKKRHEVDRRDSLIEGSLRVIQQYVGSVTLRDLLDHVNLSERQFEKRFSQTVGLSPHFYLRVKRFHEAVHLMQTRRFETLTDVAHSLNFYDQSHFIRDIKAFSGVTPRNLLHKLDDFQHGVYAYL
jgi:AraC-like DNA-binding protein